MTFNLIIAISNIIYPKFIIKLFIINIFDSRSQKINNVFFVVNRLAIVSLIQRQ